jgi:IS5 family transposase
MIPFAVLAREMSMPRKQVGQLGFEDGLVAKRRGRQRDDLEAILGLIDWQGIEAVLAPVVSHARKGEPSWPPLILFKALLLQRWHDLSDEAMEANLFDRLSFQRFCGLSLGDDVPDHSTIWRFREKLAKAGLIEPLFAELQRQLEGHGVLVKRGTLIDATLIRAAARRPKMEEGKISPNDPDARFGTSNERGRFEFGYKGHIAMDEASMLVRAQKLTSANIQEIDVAASLVLGDEAEVIADRGYDGARLRDHLEAKGISSGVMKRSQKGKPLAPEEVARNHRLAPRRRAVEAVFGTLKRIYRMSRMRYFNQVRNALAFGLALFAWNLRRLDRITAS